MDKTATSKALEAPVPVCNGAALRKATRRLSALYDDILAPSGLRLSQHSVLVHIKRAGTPTMTDLARDLVLDRSALSHNLKPLERDGFVTLFKDKIDKRSTRVSLTASGQRKLAESKALWAIAQKRFEGAFGAAKASAMRELLFEVCSDEFNEKFLSLPDR
ncbi:MAG: MarR family winged helix-turn-helix transcriptional regulator [Ottowia sp.]|uniref:MarR family winged helix-turn-helix transcriptional regulator n=1 Tax=Ottowia sp. TaxID=1898956 RepID=UPI0039E683BD